ncbi:hypothetical protein Aperf_G00000021549 [Anoplocephala perfoliata]
MRSLFVEDSFLSIEHIIKNPADGKNKLVTTNWLCPSYWHAMNLCAEVIHQRLWHLSELKKDEGVYHIEENPKEARVCRAFELSRWLAKHYPAESDQWTQSHFDDGSNEDRAENHISHAETIGTEKTPRTRRRDARRAAHRNQKGPSQLYRPPAAMDEDDILNINPSQWTAVQIASRFLHITGAEAKQISMLIESWQLTDRQRILDTSLSMSELNALGGIEATPQSSPLPQRPPPPPRPPETYRSKPQEARAHTEEPQKREVRESSRGPSSRFLGFLRRPESKKKQLETQINGRENGGWDGDGRPKNEKEEQKELLEVAAELKWLIFENSRHLKELCLEEARLTGRLPQDCIPECKAGHSPGPLTVITRSVTCQNPSNSPYETSVTPRSAVSVNGLADPPKSTQKDVPPTVESWWLKRLPPCATERFGSVENTILSSSASTSGATRQQRISQMSPGPQPHQCLKKCEIVRHPVLRSTSSVDRKKEVLPNYRIVQPVRGAVESSDPYRQRSEPPLICRTSEIRVRCYSEDLIN